VQGLDELPDFLNVDEVAALMRVSRSTAYNLVNDQTIPSCRIGRRIRVPKSALVAALNEPAAQ
jgi:excisionase family DNA binding protein